MRLLIPTFIAGVIMLAGCGQKGPLYIAQDKGPSAVAPVTDDQPTEDKPVDEKKDGEKPEK